jgi:intracellular septation protein
MKLILDFLPIVIFFAAYQLTGDLITATAVLIPVTMIQVGLVYWLTKTVEKMALVTLALVVVLGGATILLNDGWFIMWKPTVVNWAFAMVFIGSHFVGDRPVVERILAHAIHLPAEKWRTLSYAWSAFFVISGVLNLIVAYQFSEQVWVNFKLFGLLGLTFVFLLAQGIWISKHGTEVAHEQGPS